MERVKLVQRIPVRRAGKPAKEALTPDSSGNSPLGSGSFWTCVEVHHARPLLLILRHLQRQRFRTNVPLVLTGGGKGRGRQLNPPTWRPLFPGYVFVSFDPDIRWQSLFGTYGVKQVFTSQGKLLEVPKEALALAEQPEQPFSLKPRLEEDQLLADLQQRIGQEFKVKDGLFAGSSGLLQWAGIERGQLLVRLLLGHYEVRLSPDSLTRWD